MESMDTMLSDAVNISALLSYDNKFQKFRQLKKQMSNISTPSPAASPEPSNEMISIETLENDVISHTVLKTINSIGDNSNEVQSEQLDDHSSMIGSEFYPSSSSVTSISTSSTVTSSDTSAISSTNFTSLTSNNGKIIQQIIKVRNSIYM